MPAQFFTATDDKPTGTTLAYQNMMTFIRQHGIQLSPAIVDRVDVQNAIGEIWDALGGNIPTLRADVLGPLNSDASDLEIALITMFILQQKFSQYVDTL